MTTTTEVSGLVEFRCDGTTRSGRFCGRLLKRETPGALAPGAHEQLVCDKCGKPWSFYGPEPVSCIFVGSGSLVLL